MSCRLLDLLPHIIVAVEVEDVGDQVQCVLVILDIGVEAREVEAVRQVILVNLAEIFVSSRGDELDKHES